MIAEAAGPLTSPRALCQPAAGLIIRLKCARKILELSVKWLGGEIPVPAKSTIRGCFRFLWLSQMHRDRNAPAERRCRGALHPTNCSSPTSRASANGASTGLADGGNGTHKGMPRNGTNTLAVSHISGTATYDNPSAVNIGELVSSNVAQVWAAPLTTGIAANITSISLTAAIGIMARWISTTSATIPHPDHGSRP